MACNQTTQVTVAHEVGLRADQREDDGRVGDDERCDHANRAPGKGVVAVGFRRSGGLHGTRVTSSAGPGTVF